MRASPRICRYLHAPAQSGSDAVLERMNRGYTVGEYEEFVSRVFEHLPDATLAGDIIVGFPGETEADFQLTCDLVRRVPFKNNFIFKYSARPGTVAIGRFQDDIPDEVKRMRNNQLLAIQNETSARVHAAWCGRSVSVLFDAVRSRARAPERAAASVSLRVEGRTLAQEGVDAAGKWQAVGRTPGDLIVAVDVSAREDAERLMGAIHPVTITGTASLLLRGTLGAP